MSGGAVIPRVSMTLLAALVLDDRSDVPYADLERQRVLRVHAAQFAHERDHVLHGAAGQALDAHECPAASLREAGDRPGLDSVKLSHAQPPCSAVRRREQRFPYSGVPGKGAISDRANLLRPGALVAPGDRELDPLVVLEAAVAVSLDGGVVDEDVRRAVIGGDETIALVRVEPLHCALSHCALLPRRSSGCTGRASQAVATARPSGAGPGNRGARRQKFRGRCKTDTNFDCNQLHLTPCDGLTHRAGAAWCQPTRPGVRDAGGSASRCNVQAAALL